MAQANSMKYDEPLLPTHMMGGIYEYRALRVVYDNLGRDHNLLGKQFMDRIMHLNKATWPARNQELKAYNDALLAKDYTLPPGFFDTTESP